MLSLRVNRQARCFGAPTLITGHHQDVSSPSWQEGTEVLGPVGVVEDQQPSTLRAGLVLGRDHDSGAIFDPDGCRRGQAEVRRRPLAKSEAGPAGRPKSPRRAHIHYGNDKHIRRQSRSCQRTKTV